MSIMRELQKMSAKPETKPTRADLNYSKLVPALATGKELPALLPFQKVMLDRLHGEYRAVLRVAAIAPPAL